MTVLIQRRVCIEPRFLDRNIMDHLLHKVSEDVKNECTREHGYILKVLRVTRIISSEGTVFILEIEAETFRPTGGKRTQGEICMVYKDGIFINILGKQKMLIPTSTLPEHTFLEDQRVFVIGDLRIGVGDTIDVIVTAAKYANGNFSCFGSLA